MGGSVGGRTEHYFRRRAASLFDACVMVGADRAGITTFSRRRLGDSATSCAGQLNVGRVELLSKRGRCNVQQCSPGSSAGTRSDCSCSR